MGGPLVQLTLWRVRDFLREPEALFWVFAFPIVLAFALGLAFKSRGPSTVLVAVEDGPGAAELHQALDSTTGIQALLLDPSEAHNRRDVRELRDQGVTEPGSRYIDFLIPGLIGMNIMGTGLWGVGYGIVLQRNRKLIKRLLASPMRKSQYMLSHVLARLVFLVFEVGAVLAFGRWVFGVPIRGSLLSIAVIVFLGAMTFSGMGLLVASRARTVEGVSGIMNLVMVPMWIFSGIFFAYSNFPEFLHPLILAMPLTALNDALRAVMLDGTSLFAVTGLLAIVAAWGMGCFGVALKVFRWE
jgi:ABC-type multidrug transport system permease subunit